MNRIQTLLLSLKRNTYGRIQKVLLSLQQHIYANVYAILWFCALVGATSSYIELQTTKLAGIGLVSSIIFATLTLYQQYTVYRDLHVIEEDSPRAKKEYGPWINMWPEICIRYGIIISLLFGVGKIASVVYPLFTVIDKVSNSIGFYEGQCSQSVLGVFFRSESLLVVGSVFAFLFLLVWNFSALEMRPQCRPQQKSVDQREYDFKSLKIWVFTFSIIFCLAYWLTVSRGSDIWISHISEILLGLYALTIIGVAVLRSDRILQRWKDL